MSPCFENRVSMWSKKAIPVEMRDAPDPSRLMVSWIEVSDVERCMVASRGMEGFKQMPLPL
jgi:hypothetical protein